MEIQRSQHIGQGCVGIGVVLVQGDGALQYVARFVQAIQGAQRRCIVEERAEVVGPLPQRGFKLCGGVRELALRDMHEREQDARLREVRAAL